MHPILFQYGHLAVYSYGAMLAIAFLLGISVATRRAPSRQIPPQLIVDLSLWILVTSILGARLLYVASEWDYYRFHLLEILMVQKGGLVYYGGLLIGIATAVLFTRLKKVSFWKVADVMAPSIALGQALGRVGCFLNGCCFGKPTELPWGVRFPEGSPAATAYGPLTALHPAQLYSTAGDLALFFFLLWFDRRRKFDGQTFWVYVLSYGLLRFGIEFLRGDNPPFLSFMTLSQVISVGLFILSLGMLRWMSRRSGSYGKPA